MNLRNVNSAAGVEGTSNSVWIYTDLLTCFQKTHYCGIRKLADVLGEQQGKSSFRPLLPTVASQTAALRDDDAAYLCLLRGNMFMGINPEPAGTVDHGSRKKLPRIRRLCAVQKPVMCVCIPCAQRRRWIALNSTSIFDFDSPIL